MSKSCYQLNITTDRVLIGNEMLPIADYCWRRAMAGVSKEENVFLPEHGTVSWSFDQFGAWTHRPIPDLEDLVKHGGPPDPNESVLGYFVGYPYHFDDGRLVVCLGSTPGNADFVSFFGPVAASVYPHRVIGTLSEPLRRVTTFTYRQADYLRGLHIMVQAGTLRLPYPGAHAVLNASAAPSSKQAVLQPWVQELTYMQQAVLLGSIRAPDGVRKHHPCKLVYRMFRRAVLIASFEGRALDPFEPGGGSFTAPLTKKKLLDASPHLANDPIFKAIEEGTPHWALMDLAAQAYLDEIDTLPLHAHMHMVHAAEIVGYKHPEEDIGVWWERFYNRLVSALHLQPETEEEMDRRLGDNHEEWRKRDVVERHDEIALASTK